MVRAPARAQRGQRAPGLTLSARSSWTNKLITAKDHGAIQINVGHLDESGVYNNSFTTFAVNGRVRTNVRPSRAVRQRTLSLGARAGAPAALSGAKGPGRGWSGAAARTRAHACSRG